MKRPLYGYDEHRGYDVTPVGLLEHLTDLLRALPWVLLDGPVSRFLHRHGWIRQPSTGSGPYDLGAHLEKHMLLVDTPLRNRFPRIPAVGTPFAWSPGFRQTGDANFAPKEAPCPPDSI